MVKSTLRLDLPAEVLQHGTPARLEFEDAFRKSIAIRLGVTPETVVINNIE